MNILKFLRAALTICALFAGFTAAARADFYTQTGDTTGKPTFDVSAIYLDAGTAVPYDTLEFQVDRGGPYQFLTMADYDSAIFIYEGSFDPAAPIERLIWQNNDIYSPDTSGFVVMLFPALRYTLVVAGIGDGDFGQYSLTIGGPGLAQPVPEPSAWLMLGVGLAAVTCLKRRAARR